MKIKVKNKDSKISAKVSKSTITPVSADMVQLYHQQSVRQSHQYQSAECVYGLTINVPNTKEDIDAGFAKATKIVETNVVSKIQEHRALLEKLA